MSLYRYRDLPSEGDELYIRLMNLPALQENDKITCSLESYPLSQCPEFETVSYSWGFGVDDAHIHCDGDIIRIPTNLHAFLLRTCAQGKERILWVDSICINQRDDEEKSSQVAAMRKIYSESKRVLIWLGVEYNRSTLALQHATAKYNAYVKRAQNPGAPAANTHFYDRFLAVFDGKWKALFDLINRPYFSRAWIVQEIVKSKEAVIVCGDAEIPWIHLVAAAAHAINNEYWLFEFFGSTRNLFTVLSIYMSSLDNSQEQPVDKPHWEVLSRYRLQLCSDPRDKIFAFYGLSARKSLKALDIRPEYDLTAEQVYVNLAVGTLRNASTLDFLSIPRLQQRHTSMNIPSWTPDWRSSDIACTSLLMIELDGHAVSPVTQRHPYHATRDSVFQPDKNTIDENNTRLLLHGYTIGRITRTSLAWELQDTKGSLSIWTHALVLQHNQTFVHDCECVLLDTDYPHYPTGENIWDVFWQVVVAGIHPEGKEGTRKAWLSFDSRQRYFRMLRKLHLHHFVFAWCIFVVLGYVLCLLGIHNPEVDFIKLTSALIGRKIVRSENGFIGMAPGIAKVGDHIALFKGGKLPFVIRQQGSQWEMIGDAYVHGLVEGEEWDEKKCVEHYFI